MAVCSPVCSSACSPYSRYDSNVGGQRVSWLLEGHQLVCAKNECKVKATVLSEELGYNRSLQQFKIFVLDRPLDPNYTVSLTHSLTLIIQVHSMNYLLNC